MVAVVPEVGHAWITEAGVECVCSQSVCSGAGDVSSCGGAGGLGRACLLGGVQ